MMLNPIKRVAAIHDICSFSKVSLTTVIPVLASMGIQTIPLPTALLSANTAVKNPYFVDLTKHLNPIVEHWKKLKLNFDAIYSGFLGSSQQIKIVKDIILSFKTDKNIIIVDPVLGDNGKLYSVFNQKMVNEMKDLVTKADIITPNLTEAAMLLGYDFTENINNEQIKYWLKQLCDMGPEIAIITSIPEENNKTSVVAYSKKTKRFWKVKCDYIPASYAGTGDTFTSVLCGSLLQGDNLPIALERAVHFVSIAIRATFGHDHSPNEGVMLERVLDTLKTPHNISSYEVL